MRKNQCKWVDCEHVVLKHAGTLPAPDIAAMIGTTTKNLRWHCAKRGVSLKIEGYRAERMAQWHVNRKRKQPKQKSILSVDQLWKPIGLSAQHTMGNFT